MSKKIPERKELPECDKWKLEDLYPTDEAWQAELETAKSVAEELASYAGQLADASKLLAYLRLNDRASELFEKLANYAQRRSDEDTRDSHCQGMVGQLTKVWVSLCEKNSFKVPELIALSDEQMESLYTAQPDLELYRYHLEDIRRRKAHILSKNEEKLLAAAGEMAASPERVYAMFDDADLKFQPAADKDGELHPVTQGTYVSCLESPDRVLRKNAFESCYASYGDFRNTVAGMLSAQVKQLEFFSNARRYDSRRWTASLDDTNVPTAVYHNLIRGRPSEHGQDAPLRAPAEEAHGRGSSCICTTSTRRWWRTPRRDPSPLRRPRSTVEAALAPAGRGVPENSAGGL
jgi:oligoendopeptidase F